MADYGQFIYLVNAISAAKIESDGGYAAPSVMIAENKVELGTEADTDSFMSKGRRRDMISVPTHGTITIEQGEFDLAVLAQMTNSSESESGTTPNQTTAFHVSFGVDLPEFGLAFRTVSKNGAGGRFGVARAKLTKIPFFTVEQNKIIIPSLEIEFWSKSDTNAQGLWIHLDETITALPNNSSAFDTFFA